MKHGTHPSPRQRLFATVATAALALVLGTSTHFASAQDQAATHTFGYICPWPSCGGQLVVKVPEGACNWYQHEFSLVPPTTPWGQEYGGVNTYFTMPSGTQTINMQLGYNNWPYASNQWPTFQVFIDGQLCSSCTATATYFSVGGIGRTDVTMTYQADNGWPSGVHEFGLRESVNGNPVVDWRWKAVMVGSSFTDVLGYFDAPSLPVYILRDPPGGHSFSLIETNSTTCIGGSQSATLDQENSGWFKAKVGIAGEFGLIVSEDFEFYVEAGTSLSATQSSTSKFEYETCIQAGLELTTSDDGTPDDLFYVSSIHYAYGMLTTVERPSCGVITKHANFASQPVSVISSNHYNESYIKDILVPAAEAQLTTLTPGTEPYRRAAEQISVWHQMLDMNAAIKADAETQITRTFTGGGATQRYELTSTTSQMRSIEYTVGLSVGLTAEFCLEVGGSGVSGGVEMKMRQEYGKGETSSNATTNTVAYKLNDPDGYDVIAVKVGADPVFGTYTFTLDSAASQTSCKWEGGFKLDQPSISVGTPGNTSMTVNEVPLDGTAIFPLVMCNNSDTTRFYYLKPNVITNLNSADLEIFGGDLPIDGVGVYVELIGGQCITASLLLKQPEDSPDVVDFDNISLYFYTLCEEAYPPFQREYVTISAHFGEGNIGSYCTPVSAEGSAQGDYVDGVQLADIDNTGTGGVSGATYTDYSAQYSTALSRNAQKVITITPGSRTGSSVAAWIDYDHSGTFDGDEQLGQFNATEAGIPGDISFTVPAGALLGPTLMRVRCASPLGGEPTDLEACFNYDNCETEDYAVVIDDAAVQDCAGVNNGTALPGTACNDNNASTGNDTWNANCACVGEALDCAGTPGGAAGPGTDCDDSDPSTGLDLYGMDCVCAGTPFDCLGNLGGPATIGAACDDGDAGTGNDVYNASCQCAGQLIDCLGVIGGTTTVGTPCNDGNPLSGGDAYAANCECVGAFATDCAGVAGGTAQPGTACDDNDPATGNDVYSLNCTCAGEAYDCAGNPGGPQLPGTPCDDGNSASTNDTFTADCGCEGVFTNDCLGVPGGTALPGVACDDGDADTGNDMYDAFCTCAGQLTDCNGVIGGPAQPGFGCDDGNAATGGDVIDANCQCAGQLIDCLGLPGGEALVGSVCDDGNASTSDDVYTANCICAGVLPNDCVGVAGGTAQPGTTCDDGDANTGNDVYGTNCECAGEVIDCDGTIGGGLLPGFPCDDGLACTTNDVRGTDCACSGTTITIGAVTGATTVVGNTSNAFVITPIANATSYTWELPNGWSTSDNGAFVLLAEANNTAGPVQLCVTVMVGDCELTSCLTVNVDFNTGIATNEANDGEWFTVQPNPSNGIFQLRPSTTDATPLRISIRNGLGQEVLAPFSVVGQRTIDMDLSDVAAGAYYLLATRNGEQQVIKIMVQR